MLEHQKYKTHSQRSEVVSRWMASGLSQAEFCRREGIPEWCLSTWKQRVDRAQFIQKTSPSTRQKRAVGSKKKASREKHWQQIVNAHAISGLSAVQFCKENGVNINSFKRWRRLFPPQASKRSLPVSRAKPANPFVPVYLKDQSSTVAGETVLEIELQGGGKIRVNERTPLELLSKILKALEGKC